MTTIDPFDDFAAPFCPWCGDRDTASAWHDRTHCLAVLVADPDRVTEAELRDRPDPLPTLALAIRRERLSGDAPSSDAPWAAEIPF